MSFRRSTLFQAFGRVLLALGCVASLACSFRVNAPGDAPVPDAGSTVVANGCPGPADAGMDGGIVDAGTPSFAAQVTGLFQGQAFKAMDGVVLPSLQLSFGVAGDGALILTSYVGTCGRLVAGAGAPNSAALVIETIPIDAQGNLLPTVSGDYVVGTGMNLPPSSFNSVAYFQTDDAMCNATPMQATSGTVHVTTFSLLCGGGESGTFDLWFGPDELKGTYTAPFCLGPATDVLKCVP